MNIYTIYLMITDSFQVFRGTFLDTHTTCCAGSPTVLDSSVLDFLPSSTRLQQYRTGLAFERQTVCAYVL